MFGVVEASAVVIVIYALVFFWLRAHPLRARFMACCFVTSLVTTQLAVKQLASRPFHYRFPAWLTTLHFCSTWLVCTAYWAMQRDLGKCLPSSQGSLRRYLVFIAPIAISFPLSVVFNNQALIYVGAGLNAIIATLSPVTTAVLSRACGHVMPQLAWLGICIACVGAVVISVGEIRGDPRLRFAGVGIIFSLAAVLTRSIKAVLQDRLLTPSAYVTQGPSKTYQQEVPMEPMHAWALQAPPCALMSVVYSLCSESLPAAVAAAKSPQILAMILTTCTSAVTLNILGMMTIKQLGATSMQIIGKLNIIVVIVFSVAFLHERLHAEAVLGTCFVLVGVATFEYAKGRAQQQQVKARADKENLHP